MRVGGGPARSLPGWEGLDVDQEVVLGGVEWKNRSSSEKKERHLFTEPRGCCSLNLGSFGVDLVVWNEFEESGKRNLPRPSGEDLKFIK